MDISNAFTKRATLVAYHGGCYGTERKDKKRSDELTKAAGAGSREAKVVQNLMGPEIEPIRQHVRASRTEHERWTLAFTIQGMRVLPNALILQYKMAMADREREFWDMVLKVSQSLANVLTQEEQRKKELFNADLYPSADEFIAGFSWGIQYLPVPSPANSRTMGWLDDVPEDLAKEMAADLVGDVEMQAQKAMKEAWTRTHKVLENLTASLSGEKGFHYTLFSKVGDLVEIMPGLNMTDDPVMAKVTDDLRDTFASFGDLRDIDNAKGQAKDLRKDEAAMTSMANQLKDAAKAAKEQAMADFF